MMDDKDFVSKKEFDYVVKSLVDSLVKINLERVKQDDRLRVLEKANARRSLFEPLSDNGGF